MHQPTTLTISEPGFEPIEIIDLGETIILMQRDETGEPQSIVLGPQAVQELRAIAVAHGGAQ